ncbi:hypothetical protein CXB51_014962 [Gossypium anomalum]|uniref:acid phosphatase n=1 Tax=Gossypium anomalum TaxID=47600 RepID=A0A8J6D310_9ROSI|nr:hypothetical protein CXB51_014962 [Gossypium anomalum]
MLVTHSVFLFRKEWPSEDIPLDHEVFAVPTGHNAPQQKLLTIYSLLASIPNPFQPIGTGDSAREFWFQTPPKISPDVPYKLESLGSVFFCNLKQCWNVFSHVNQSSSGAGQGSQLHPELLLLLECLDLGQTYNSLSTLEHYMQRGAQTVLFVGDLSYADRYQYNEVGIRWEHGVALLRKVLHIILGYEHLERVQDEVVPFKSYLQRYPTPHLSCKSSSPMWYAIRRASAHIIVLSSYSPFVKYTPQYEWLSEELKKVDREKTSWLIVLMHMPIYNSNEAHFMEGESMRAVFEE